MMMMIPASLSFDVALVDYRDIRWRRDNESHYSQGAEMSKVAFWHWQGYPLITPYNCFTRSWLSTGDISWIDMLYTVFWVYLMFSHHLTYLLLCNSPSDGEIMVNSLGAICQQYFSALLQNRHMFGCNFDSGSGDKTMINIYTRFFQSLISTFEIRALSIAQRRFQDLISYAIQAFCFIKLFSPLWNIPFHPACR